MYVCEVKKSRAPANASRWVSTRLIKCSSRVRGFNLISAIFGVIRQATIFIWERDGIVVSNLHIHQQKHDTLSRRS